MSLPPREPPDLRDPANRRGQQQQPPHDPYGQQPQPPNWGNQPPQYPPQYPQQPPPPNWGNQPYPPQQPPMRGQTGPLGPVPPQQPVRQQPRNYYNDPGIPPAQPRPLGARGMWYDAMHERRIEYLAWGIVVIIMGFSIILMTLDTDFATDFLLIVSPLVSGIILLASGFVQRLFFNYDVSLATWALAILGIAFGCTQAIAEITGRDTDLATQIIYFVGLLVIISGLVIILQVFRPAGRE